MSNFSSPLNRLPKLQERGHSLEHISFETLGVDHLGTRVREDMLNLILESDVEQHADAKGNNTRYSRHRILNPSFKDSRYIVARDTIKKERDHSPIIGMGALSADIDDKTTAILTSFVVSPSYQGRGIGRFLLAEAVKSAHLAGYSRIRLETNGQSDEHAASLYLNNGFKVVPASAFASEIPADRQVYELAFAPTELGLKQ